MPLIEFFSYENKSKGLIFNAKKASRFFVECGCVPSGFLSYEYKQI